MADTNLTRDLEEACHPDAPLNREWLAKLAHRALLAVNAATPPEDAALADALICIAVTGVDFLARNEIESLNKAAAALRAQSSEIYDAHRTIQQQQDTMRRQEKLIEDLRARAVPIEWRRVVRELMALSTFKPLCQKNVMDGCRCYDCVMERAGALIDEQSMLAASKGSRDAPMH